MIGARRILFLSDTLGNGGAERQLTLLIKYLPLEWDRQVWSLEDGPFAKIIRDLGVQVNLRQRSHRLDISPALDLWHIIEEWRPNLVHSWGWMCSIAAGPICTALKVPLIDGSIRMGMKPLQRALGLRIGMIFAARVVANSQAGLSVWGIDSRRGRVIYNGFDPKRFMFCKKHNLAPEGIFLAVMTGRMVPEKDYRTFISAARSLIMSNESGWRFIAIGDGPDRIALMNEARSLIDSGIMIFPEPVLEVLELVNNAQVGVLMSQPILHAEGISNSIMEYMACGIPVICADSGGNRELVVDGKTGFIIPPSDIQALAERLLYIREHPEEGRCMGEAGKQRLLENFSVEKMVDKTLQIYAEVL